MKTSGAKFKQNGFTLIEVLIVIALIAILAAMILPPGSGPRRAYVTMCLSNQRQIDFALKEFQSDHNGHFPWQEPITNGGSMDPVTPDQASRHFQTLTQYFNGQTRTFICPSDKARQSAETNTQISNKNISYFINLEAVTNGDGIRTGDRNLELNHSPIMPGIFIQMTNMTLNWSGGFHRIQNMPAGVISFDDGHAEITSSEKLNLKIQRQLLTTNRFCFP